ncbi:Adenylyltransferase [Bacillus subtilis]|nr:ThiF family adenylyltransferase [Bacillus subtilis]CAF1774133.1 Molybdopterin-synthase adenylyltransferase [Bacillus subtilis]CAI6222637.1 Adenylyltransferase [Bacillus subtilis]
MYKLADRIQIVSLHNGKIFLIDDEITELEGSPQHTEKALKLLEKGCMEEELNRIMPLEDTQKLLEFLKEEELLRENWENEYLDTIVEKQLYYLDDFSIDSNQLQSNLKSAKVVILGVGGVGSVLIQHLIGAGIENFILIDNDVVNIHNLNRQFLYTQEDIGKPKVKAAENFMRKVNPSVKVTSYQTTIDSIKSLDFLASHSIDIFINAADYPKHLDKIVDEYCFERKIPWVGSGVGRHQGFWGPLFVPEKTCCLNCFIAEEEKEMKEIEKIIRERSNSIIQASFAPTNTIVSAFLAMDVIHFLAQINQIHSYLTRCQIDFTTLKLNRFTIDEPKLCNCGGE